MSMAEKRNRLPPPPPPPAKPSTIPISNSNSSSSSSSGKKSVAPPPLSPSTPLANGTTEQNNHGTEKQLSASTGKPKPPAKPSKIARAFSSGSISMPSFGKIGKGRKKAKNSDNGSSNAAVDSEDVAAKKENGTPSRENGNGTVSKNGNGTTKDDQQQQQPWKLPGIGNTPKLSKGSPGRKGGAATAPVADSAATPGGKEASKTPPRSPRSLKKATMSESSLPTTNALLSPTESSNPPPSEALPAEPHPQGNPPSPVPGFKSNGCKKQSPLTKSKVYHPESVLEQAPPGTPPRKASLSASARASAGGGGGGCGQDDSSPVSTTTNETPPPPPAVSVVDSDPSIVAQFRPLPPTPTLSEQEDEGEGEEGIRRISDSPTRQDIGSPEHKLEVQEEEGEYASIAETNKAVKPNLSPDTEAEPAREDSQPKADESSKMEASDEHNSQAASENSQTLSSSNLNKTDASPAHQDGGNVQDYTIGEVVSTYAYALPVRVRILQGYCSDTTEVNISTDDIYNIHSVQHVKKVLVKDEDGMAHRISLDASLKIGVIYNPRGDYEESLDGYTFKTISEVTAMPVLPKLISATQTVGSAEEKNSVTEGEIFVVKHVNRSMFKGKKGLKVFSLTTRSNKVLFDDCPGYFSTKPSLVRVDLPELLDMVGDVFPSSAVIYPTTDDSSRMSGSDFPGTLSRVVTLLECSTDSALVVSDVSYMDENELEEANLLPVPTTSPTSFDIPLDEDISALEVAVLRWTYPEELDGGEQAGKEEEEELGHLYDDTMEIRSKLGSNEELGASRDSMGGGGQPHFGSAGNLSLSQQDERKAESNAGPMQDHTYVNILQQTTPTFGSDSWSDKEKTFVEEDEDAGYDTVGLHLIGGDQLPPAPPPPSSAHHPNSPLPPLPTTPSPTTSSNNGYSTVHHFPKMVEEKDPFPDHGYSTVHMHRNNKPVIEATPTSSSLGYSTVADKRTVNGIVKEVWPPVASSSEGGGGGSGLPAGGVAGKEGEGGKGEGGGEGAQLATMMENLEARLKTISMTQQSTEISKMQNVLEMLTSKLEAVDTQLTSLATSQKPPTEGGGHPAGAESTITKQGATPLGEGVSEEEHNKTYLKTLDVDQVCTVMEAMGLGQYRVKVQEEQLSGEILLECDDTILQEEVGMTSRIHRIRVMKLITGQHSAKSLLEKGGGLKT